MSLKSAFTTSWKSFKNFVVKADIFVTANAPKIQAAVKTGEQIAVAVDPALAPIVTIFDSFEEALAGEVFAAVHTGAALVSSTDGATTVTLSAELSGLVKHLADTLSGHPEVVALTSGAAKS